MTNQEKAAAERERKARIRRAQQHLAELPKDEQDHVVESASEKEAQAREAGSRRASVAFLEDALVAWSIGGTLMAAHRKGITLTPEQTREVVEAADVEYRGTDPQGVTDTSVAQDRQAAIELRATAAAEVTVAADATPEQLGAAANQLAEDMVGKLRAKAVALREKGLTVAEVAKELNVNPALARDLCGDEKRGGKVAKKTTEPRPKRAARDVRTHRGQRQEKCPECGEWKPAQQDAAGKYLKESDYREGRGDCRACYNRRWLEGKQRREAAKKQGAK